MNDKIKTNGGITSRLGEKFHKEIERIKDQRLRNGNSKDRVSTEKITNCIVRYDYWKHISNKIIEFSEEELNEYGKG